MSDSDRLVPWWDDRSRRVWSLWDMLQIDIKPFADAIDLLCMWHIEFSRHKYLSQITRDDVISRIRPLITHMREHGFSFCILAAERLITTAQAREDGMTIAIAVQELRTRLLDQFLVTYCLCLTDSERRMYDPDEPPFGTQVSVCFPSANDDIYEADKCLALGRATACVMHLNRAAEVGLSALAKRVGVEKQNDWGAYLRKIDSAIQEKSKNAGASSDDEQFYSEAALRFDQMRKAWRNPTMHPEKSYSVERATEIRGAVRSFFIHLATKVSE